MSFKYGIEVLLQDKKTLAELKKKRVSLVCHPASTDQKLNHSMDLLYKKINLVSAFGPQHGVKGEKQYNMVESADEVQAVYKIPIFSLYGEHRRPTKKMMDTFDWFGWIAMPLIIFVARTCDMSLTTIRGMLLARGIRTPIPLSLFANR